MCFEHLDQALILCPVFLQAFQLVAAGAEGTSRCGEQAANGGSALLAGIDQILAQCADNAVAPGVDFADLRAVLSGSFDKAAGAGVNNGGHSAGLGVEGVFRWHVLIRF